MCIRDRYKAACRSGWTFGIPGCGHAGTDAASLSGAAGAFYQPSAGGDEGKMPSEHSSGNDGKPAFSDSDVLAATEERGETMDVNLIFRIAAVGILVSVICQVLKHSGRDEQAFLTSLAGLVLVLFWMVPYIYDLFETMKRLFLL